MKVTKLLCLLCTISIGFKTCSGELTDGDNSNSGKCEHEKQRLREADQDIKIANLVNKVMAQNVKIANLESTIIAQKTEFEKLVNQVLERRISQITSDYRFHERLQQEIEQRQSLNESQNTLAENMKALETNHKTGIDELKGTQSVLRENMEMCFQKQSLLESDVQKIVNETIDSSSFDELKPNQSVLREKMEICFEKQSILESDLQKIVNETKRFRLQTEINTDYKSRTANLTRTSRDCQDVQSEGSSISGVYSISDIGPVYCDMDTDGGGWTVFQHRYDGSVDFYRTWADYKTGFGNLRQEFWLGNDHIHTITKQGKYKLRIEMEDFSGNKHYAEYSNFSVADEKNKYRLKIGSYSGTAGDALSYHNIMAFSTKDADNDIHSTSCPTTWRGAWWYKSCYYSNLNGLYRKSATSDYKYNVWRHWPGGDTNMKVTSMMMKKYDIVQPLR